MAWPGWRTKWGFGPQEALTSNLLKDSLLQERCGESSTILIVKGSVPVFTIKPRCSEFGTPTVERTCKDCGAMMAKEVCVVAGAAWDLLEEDGLAGLFLVASPHVGHDVTGPVEALRRPFVERWMHYIEQVVPARIDAEMVVELWMATFYRLALKWRAGEISREEGNELLIRYCVSILEGLTSYR